VLVPINKTIDRREAGRESKAEKAARLEMSIEKELLERLKSGVYEGSGMYGIVNEQQEAFEKALKKVGAEEDWSGEELSEDEEENDHEEEEREMELVDSDGNEFEMEHEEEENDDDDGFGYREFVEGLSDESDEEDENDIEDWLNVSLYLSILFF